MSIFVTTRLHLLIAYTWIKVLFRITGWMLKALVGYMMLLIYPPHGTVVMQALSRDLRSEIDHLQLMQQIHEQKALDVEQDLATRLNSQEETKTMIANLQEKHQKNSN